jgi:hypothetical protein
MSQNITRIDKLPSAFLPENDLVIRNDLILSKRPVSRIVLTEWGMRRCPESPLFIRTYPITGRTPQPML